MKEKEMTEKQNAKTPTQKSDQQRAILTKKISEPIQSFEEASSCNTFMEYFYVFGANEKTVAKEEFYLKSKFTQPGYLKMQLLSKFPPFEKPNSNIDENIIMNHCFPNGFNLIASDDLPKHECFHFNLDNLNSLGNDDKKIYFTCFLFYEELTTYYEILIRIKKHSKTNSGKLRGLTSELNKLIRKYYVPKAIVLSSFVPFPDEEKFLLRKILGYVKGMTKGIESNIIIPIEKVIEKLVLGIPRPPKGKFYITYKNNNCIIPNNESNYDIKQRELNQYNYYSYKMHLIFMFQPDEIIDILKCLLLESPILFFSKNKEKLTNTFETFMCLLSPFEYQYPHVSILPDINAGIIEMANSFAFGINYEWIEPNNKEGQKTYFEKLNLNVFNKTIKIVDLDHRILTKYYFPTQRIISFNDLGKKIVKDDFSLFITSKEKTDVLKESQNIEFPSHYTKKFKSRLEELKQNNKIKSSDCNMKFNRIIGEDYFYYFLASIFQNYNKYLFNTEEETRRICREINEKNNIDEIPIEHLCKISTYLKEFKDDTSFFTSFFKTKIFKNFLIRKYLNNDVDKFIFLHFDETILSKRNHSFFKRSVKTEFLESKILQATHCYGVDTTQNFSQEEYSFISTHQDELIYYYQRFNGFLFTYYLFPKLIYDNKYFQKLYMPPKFFDKFLFQQMQDYQKSVEALEQPKYFKIYDGDLIVRHLHNTKNDLAKNEIKNDVLLLWLRVFCLTFYYCLPKEKIIRYVEMLENIKKAIYLREDILSLLLITLQRYGDDSMVIKFFENFKSFKYNQFSYMSNKLFAPYIREPPQLKQLSISNSKLLINYFKDKEDVPKTFELNIKKIDYILHHRTFWGDGIEGKIEKLRFENPICSECKKVNPLNKLMTNYKNMTKDINLPCLHCKKLVFFNTNVRLGTKFNGDDININIYNPYYLYNVISTKLIKIYGNKIDLNDLRNIYKDFFWNCILNFKLSGLSCDMLLKYNKLYKVKVEKVKKEIVIDKKKGKDKSKKDAKESNKNKFDNLEICNEITELYKKKL